MLKTTIKQITNSYTKSKVHTPIGDEMLTILKNFERIEEKSRCVRVRFLDWLSKKLMMASKKIKEASDRIHSPCKIKI